MATNRPMREQADREMREALYAINRCMSLITEHDYEDDELISIRDSIWSYGSRVFGWRD